jgi:6-pyruvoyltetrahydropterin/6-carboxytetrahydropterin synthase
MISIARQIDLDAGHRVPSHQGKCRNPHGHRYTIVADVRAEDVIREEGNPEDGMVVDFGFLKELMMTRIHDVLDHGFIVYERDSIMRELAALETTFKWVFVPFVPTAENIAMWCFDQLEAAVLRLSDGRAELVGVTVFETPNSSAWYGPDPS